MRVEDEVVVDEDTTRSLMPHFFSISSAVRFSNSLLNSPC